MAFKKGFDPNRNYKGAPRKGKSFAELLRKKIPADDLAQVLIDKALEGDMVAIRVLLEYSWGKPDPEFERRIDELQQKLEQAIAESRGNHAA